jgi:hypothetical protein
MMNDERGTNDETVRISLPSSASQRSHTKPRFVDPKGVKPSFAMSGVPKLELGNQ